MFGIFTADLSIGPFVCPLPSAHVPFQVPYQPNSSKRSSLTFRRLQVLAAMAAAEEEEQEEEEEDEAKEVTNE